jgi:pilus assembly protein CpaE
MEVGMAEKILIVDDDLETLRLIGVMLQRQGYEISAANTGELAISMAKKEKPDLIVLDIMMPLVDGYRVAREIRNDPSTTHVPILMFTAKSQVDDKVAGYEAGADDFLTKPVHPAELSAHVKALLEKAVKPTAGDSKKNSAYIIGIASCKGGLGVSTLALNLGIAYNALTDKETLAVELKPGMGSWGVDLDIAESHGLEKILALPIEEITPEVAEQNAVFTSFGIRLLMASNNTRQITFTDSAEKTIAMIDALSTLVPVLILDIGNPYLPGFDHICSICDQLLVITDAFPATVLRTRRLLGNIQLEPARGTRNIQVVLYNHVRSDLFLTAEQVTKLLPGNPVRVLIPPVPEQVFQANQKYIPLIKIQPEGLYAQQVNELARIIRSKA